MLRQLDRFAEVKVCGETNVLEILDNLIDLTVHFEGSQLF
jgi:hypothetical protein